MEILQGENYGTFQTVANAGHDRHGCHALDACDSNNSGTITSADANYLYNYMFNGGNPPPAPFSACGVDPPGTHLGCSTPGHSWCDQNGPPPRPGEFGVLIMEDFGIPVNGPGTAQIFAADFDAGKKATQIQGFQIVVNSPPELELVEINIAGTVPEQNGAELVIAQILDPHALGLLVVVMDATEPFKLQTIPLDDTPVHIANFLYSCSEHPVAPEPAVQHGVFLSNFSRLFKDGEVSEPLQLEDGIAFCLPDECVVSDESPTVVIGDCDSGVENLLLADGCTMADKIAACTAGTPSHKQLMGCIDALLSVWKETGVITQNDSTLIHNCAVNTGKKK